jgi:hypothetical protein
MTLSREHLIPMLGLTGLLALTGCVDAFTTRPPEAGVWSGTTTAGRTDLAECAPFGFLVDIHDNPVLFWPEVSGRAFPTVAPVGTRQQATNAVTTWWVDGYMMPSNFIQFESRMQAPLFFGARPYAVWRGTLDDDRIALVESGSPCGRELVLTRR